ncbi:MAG TPA: HupE/UreJ family protein [Verrucomicrobiae bacterium]|nr:HupE/UreJ family protein [Verrucomicrobiae bacterium]
MPVIALAHPVAQGALSIDVNTNAVFLSVRVSSEEALVANTFAATGAKAQSLSEIWQQHGDYLLQHLKIFADDHRLAGTVAGVDSSQPNFIVYKFNFPVASAPHQLRVEQNVLNEIEFAPGNPWEATYVVTTGQKGQTLQQGLLLSRTQPLEFACDWQNTAEAPPAVNKSHLIYQYIRYGINHILTGYDHLLFVCALVLTAVTLLDLIKVITAFTVAHTITLVLSVLNIVRLPSHIVEPMIAGSIVFVALTNIISPRRARGNLRIATAFFFGLFHGLGFAGGLLDAMSGLSGLTVGLAIGAFSLGVEIGHQMVVLPVFFGLKFARVKLASEAGQEQFSLGVVRAGSFVITIAGTVYLIAALRG